MNQESRKKNTDYRLKFYTEISTSMENPILEAGKIEVIQNNMINLFDKEKYDYKTNHKQLIISRFKILL